eukprot:1140558-Pelagomonas_calceolata.AAC.8
MGAYALTHCGCKWVDLCKIYLGSKEGVWAPQIDARACDTRDANTENIGKVMKGCIAFSAYEDSWAETPRLVHKHRGVAASLR